MIAVLVIALSLTTFALCFVCWRNEDLHREMRFHDGAAHAKCIAHIASAVSAKIVADALRQAADRYDSVENQAQMHQITRSWRPESTHSVPSLWLREEASRIEKEAHSAD